jgi:phosphomevalonate kinase
LSGIKKTGLGSSSALIVSCIGALLDNIGVDDVDIFYELCFKTNYLA